MNVSVKWKQNWLLEALPEMQFVVWHALVREQDSLVRLVMMLMGILSAKFVKTGNGSKFISFF